jgi:hypothetical protein
VNATTQQSAGPLHLHFTNTKQQGDYAEMRFQVEGTEHGLFPSKPYGDSMPYDFIGDNGRCLVKIQVKSVIKFRGGRYTVRTHRCPERSTHNPGKFRAYRPSDTDFIAALVIPENVWYIIPLRALEGRTAIFVYPQNLHSRGMFERYKEAWHLLE